MLTLDNNQSSTSDIKNIFNVKSKDQLSLQLEDDNSSPRKKQSNKSFSTCDNSPIAINKESRISRKLTQLNLKSFEEIKSQLFKFETDKLKLKINVIIDDFLHSMNFELNDKSSINELIIISVDIFNKKFENENLKFRLTADHSKLELKQSKKNGYPKEDLPNYNKDVILKEISERQFTIIYQKKDLLFIRNKSKCVTCTIM